MIVVKIIYVIRHYSKIYLNRTIKIIVVNNSFFDFTICKGTSTPHFCAHMLILDPVSVQSDWFTHTLSNLHCISSSHSLPFEQVKG